MFSFGFLYTGEHGADIDLLAGADMEFGEHSGLPDSHETLLKGLVMVCSIFMASSQISGWPAVTVSPTAAPTRTTDPGIGASREPCATAVSGSGKRGWASRRTAPSGESTNTSSPYRAMSKVRSTPSTERTTRSGVADTRATPSWSGNWTPDRVNR